MRFLNTEKFPEVERVASKDASRPVLTYLFLRIVNPEGKLEERKGFLEATDSYKLARVPVELHEEDVEGFVPAEALKALKKATKRHAAPHLVCTAADIALVADGQMQTWQRIDVGKFADVDSLMPTDLSGFKFGINAHYLSDLAKALGSKEGQVVIQFVRNANVSEGDSLFSPSNLRPMVVRASSNDGDDAPVGLAMPVRVT